MLRSKISNITNPIATIAEFKEAIGGINHTLKDCEIQRHLDSAMIWVTEKSNIPAMDFDVQLMQNKPTTSQELLFDNITISTVKDLLTGDEISYTTDALNSKVIVDVESQILVNYSCVKEDNAVLKNTIIAISLSVLSFGQGVFVDDAGHLRIDNKVVNGPIRLNLNNPDTALATAVSISGNNNYFEYLPMTDITSITKSDGSPYASVIEFEYEMGSVFTTIQEVYVLDQTSPTVILPMALEVAATTTDVLAVKDSYTIDVVSVSGFLAGQHIRILDTSLDRFYFGSILAINGTTITLDTPLDFAYTVGSQVIVATTNMNVNGSVTPVTFKHRLGSPSTNKATHITRIIFTCTTNGSIDLLGFGDLATLIRGLVIRRVNGEIFNVLNVKSNADLSNTAYDFNVYEATNPSQGVDGFVCRLTFAGQNKLGVALRLEVGENLEVIVQDDLTGLVSLKIIAEGHIVD